MRAVRYYGKEDIRIEQIPEPTVGQGQVKIAPAFVGLCGTDLHEYLGGPVFCPTHRHPLTGESIPVTLGHEFSGVITEIGPDVAGFRIGQPCCIQPTIFCGACPACKSGAENVCRDGGFGGGLSEAVCVDAKSVFALPESVGLETGALVEPLAVAWHALSAAPELAPASTVLIIGGGPIGLALILCLKAKGVETIVVSEIAASRQSFARQFGATQVVNPLHDDINKVVLDVSGGSGADVAFDCAGVPASIKSACAAVRARGTVVNVAIWEKEVPFNPNWVMHKDSNFRSVLGYHKQDFEAVIENLRTGAIEPNGMITAKIRFDNVVEDGIKKLISDRDSHVKILVDINAT
ncbi:GroES-like protein [Astrocystis sublimbata]|nr:GroES-like protein [Astrocystis sublimbata]